MEIARAGGVVAIINEENVHTVPDILVGGELVSNGSDWEQLEFDFGGVQ